MATAAPLTPTLPDDLNPEFEHQQLHLDPEAFAIVHELADAGVITPVSLRGLDDLDYEQRRSLAVYFGEQSRHLQWWVGDLLNDSEQRDGHLFAQLAADTGLSEGALQRRMYVCRQVAVKRRRPGLPFSVHMVVAPLGARDQERWLKEAAERQMTALVLRDAIRAEGHTERQPLFEGEDDDSGDHVATDTGLVLAAARAILRDARPADDGQHYLIPNEDVARLKAAFGEEE
jgi:hypothetical protein